MAEGSSRLYEGRHYQDLAQWWRFKHHIANGDTLAETKVIAEAIWFALFILKTDNDAFSLPEFLVEIERPLSKEELKTCL